MVCSRVYTPDFLLDFRQSYGDGLQIGQWRPPHTHTHTHTHTHARTHTHRHTHSQRTHTSFHPSDSSCAAYAPVWSQRDATVKQHTHTHTDTHTHTNTRINTHTDST